MSRVKSQEKTTKHYELAFPSTDSMPRLLGDLYDLALPLGDLRFSQDLYSTGKGSASFTPRDLGRDSVKGAFKDLESKLNRAHIKWEYCRPPRLQRAEQKPVKPETPAAPAPLENEKHQYTLFCRENIVVPVALGNIAASVTSSGIGWMSTSEYIPGRTPEISFEPYSQDSKAAKKFEQLLSRSGFDWKRNAKSKPLVSSPVVEKVPGS